MQARRGMPLTLLPEGTTGRRERPRIVRRDQQQARRRSAAAGWHHSAETPGRPGGATRRPRRSAHPCPDDSVAGATVVRPFPTEHVLQAGVTALAAARGLAVESLVEFAASGLGPACRCLAGERLGEGLDVGVGEVSCLIVDGLLCCLSFSHLMLLGSWLTCVWGKSARCGTAEKQLPLGEEDLFTEPRALAGIAGAVQTLDQLEELLGVDAAERVHMFPCAGLVQGLPIPCGGSAAPCFAARP